MQRGKIIFLLSIILMGSLYLPTNVYAQQREVIVSVRFEDQEFILSEIMSFSLDQLQQYLGDGNSEEDHLKVGLYLPTWTYYVHSGTQNEGLGNYLYDTYIEQTEQGNDSFFIQAEIFENGQRIGDGFQFIALIKEDDDPYPAEPNHKYLSTCSKDGSQLLFSIEITDGG